MRLLLPALAAGWFLCPTLQAAQIGSVADYTDVRMLVTRSADEGSNYENFRISWERGDDGKTKFDVSLMVGGNRGEVRWVIFSKDGSQGEEAMEFWSTVRELFPEEERDKISP